MPEIDYVMRKPEACKVLGVHKETLRLWVKKALLPRPIKLGPRAVGWLKSDIENFIASRAAQR